jgi:hypothetical protein
MRARATTAAALLLGAVLLRLLLAAVLLRLLLAAVLLPPRLTCRCRAHQNLTLSFSVELQPSPVKQGPDTLEVSRNSSNFSVK